MLNVLAIVTALGLAAGSASAFEKLEGYFIAEQVCDAYKSKNKQTHPGEMTTALSTAYVMKGLNQVAGAPVAESGGSRWIAVCCSEG